MQLQFHTSECVHVATVTNERQAMPDALLDTCKTHLLVSNDGQLRRLDTLQEDWGNCAEKVCDSQDDPLSGLGHGASHQRGQASCDQVEEP